MREARDVTRSQYSPDGVTIAGVDRELFSGNGWHIRLETASLPDGRTETKAIAQFADTVHVIACTQTGKILMLREYRPFYGAWVWQLPSGHVDKEADVAVAAQRELQEETGFRAGSLRFLWKTNTKENFRQTCHMFLASELVKAPLAPDEDELMEVHELTLEEAIDHVLTSPNINFPSATALMRYERELLQNYRAAGQQSRSQ
jgi:ADP-ribose pyrophosphatase